MGRRGDPRHGGAKIDVTRRVTLGATANVAARLAVEAANRVGWALNARCRDFGIRPSDK